MCSNCKARVEHGVTALPDGAQPIPMVVADFGDKVGIITSQEGWIALKVLMSMVGGMIQLDGD
jgi:hypothetical protein